MDAIDGSCSGYVQRAVVGIAPRQVRGLFRQVDRAQMMAPGIPDPNPSRPRHVEIALLVYLDPIGDAIAFASGFFPKDSAVLYGSVGIKVVDANISLLAVVHI